MQTSDYSVTVNEKTKRGRHGGCHFRDNIDTVSPRNCIVLFLH